MLEKDLLWILCQDNIASILQQVDQPATISCMLTGFEHSPLQMLSLTHDHTVEGVQNKSIRTQPLDI